VIIRLFDNETSNTVIVHSSIMKTIKDKSYTPVPYDCDGITPEMIDETARIIYGIYNSHTSI
jgi:hypothetical protein